jgi:sugar (pentulose or hexulose) kinase
MNREDNGPVQILDRHYWPILNAYTSCIHGLSKASRSYSESIAGIGVDAWGVCFALLDSTGNLVGNPPYCRGPQADQVHQQIFSRLSKEAIFRTTGLRVSRLNSLYQLMEMVLNSDPALQLADRFVMIPDLINYWLTGRIAVEYTNASTTHLLNVYKKDWDLDLIRAMGIQETLFPEVVKPGTILGRLSPAVSHETSLPRIPVVATASHDTAAAIAAVPAREPNFAYLSSGTWGLLGSEISNPIISGDVYEYGFVNQGGVEDTIRLLHNSLNMWLLQECRRIWSLDGNNDSWDDLLNMAERAEAFKAFIDPDDHSLLLPKNMPLEIQKLCETGDQVVPYSKGEIVRVILESLAFKNRYLFEKLTKILNRRSVMLHVVGGGARNRLLNQFLADAFDVPVMTGPYEATAVGNILVQMIANGELRNLSEGRELVRRSFSGELFEPACPNIWEGQYERFLRVSGVERLPESTIVDES